MKFVYDLEGYGEETKEFIEKYVLPYLDIALCEEKTGPLRLETLLNNVHDYKYEQLLGKNNQNIVETNSVYEEWLDSTGSDDADRFVIWALMANRICFIADGDDIDIITTVAAYLETDKGARDNVVFANAPDGLLQCTSQRIWRELE